MNRCVQREHVMKYTSTSRIWQFHGREYPSAGGLIETVLGYIAAADPVSVTVLCRKQSAQRILDRLQDADCLLHWRRTDIDSWYDAYRRLAEDVLRLIHCLVGDRMGQLTLDELHGYLSVYLEQALIQDGMPLDEIDAMVDLGAGCLDDAWMTVMDERAERAA